jgi:hypothetical protein
VQIRYTNDLGNGHSGYVDSGDGIVVATASGQPLSVELENVETTSRNRLLVTNPETVFFNTFQYGVETDVWESSATSGGTATHSALLSAVDMAVTSTAGSQIIRQTLNTMRYIPGRAASLAFAVRYETPVVGIRRRVGLFNGTDGFYFEDNGGDYACSIVSSTSGSTVTTRVARASWNGDKLDGTGPSGITADPTAQQLINMKYEWYGAGQIVFQYIINGQAITIHTFNTGNILQNPWCKTPFLPIRLELTNVTGASGTHHLYQGSNTLTNEGSTNYLGVGESHLTTISGITMANANTFYPILSIRLKSTALQGIVLPSFIQASTTDNTNIFYKILRNATVTQGTWTNMPDANSFVQYLESPATGTTALTDGSLLDAGMVIGGTGDKIGLDKNTVYQLGRSSLGTVSDVFTLAVAATGANKSAVVAMTWIEQR